MESYEQLLNADTAWAFQEGSMHFEKESAVHKTLQGIARRLDEIGVPYAIAGGMALFFHGLRRFTEDVDILVNTAGLEKIHQELSGLGYVPVFEKSRNLRDADSGVRIEFLVTGDFPGDGKPKAIAFPDPSSVGVEIEGIRFLTLKSLIELKLASGMTNPLRIQDIADVQRLIEQLKLSQEFADDLHSFVRDKYLELWALVQNASPGP